jgi:hypothetical protein
MATPSLEERIIELMPQDAKAALLPLSCTVKRELRRTRR